MDAHEANRRQQAYARPNFMPDGLVRNWDLIKGVGEVVLESITKRHITEPKPFTVVTEANVDELLPPE